MLCLAMLCRHNGMLCPPIFRPRAVCYPLIGCLGRSRGGLTTKIHAVVDALGLPIELALS